MSAVEKFPVLLSEAEEESSAVPPCFSDEGINVRSHCELVVLIVILRLWGTHRDCSTFTFAIRTSTSSPLPSATPMPPKSYYFYTRSLRSSPSISKS